MSMRTLLAAAMLACAGLVNLQAATLAGDGAWHEFDVDAALAGGLGWIDLTGASLSFEFTIGPGEVGVLTVVDAGFVGDTFTVRNGAAVLGSTSAVPVHVYDGADTAIADFDAALADPAFSRGLFTLGAGTYSIDGVLAQSVQDAFGPLNATVGGVRLEVALAAVPEPASLAMLAAGLGLFSAVARRRTR